MTEVSRERAVELATAWIRERAASPAATLDRLVEFDAGYVGFPIWSPEQPAPLAEPDVEGLPGEGLPGEGLPGGRPETAPRPPRSVGGARCVVDKATGEVTSWPSLPAEQIIAMYRQRLAGLARFPAEVYQALTRAGWRPGRDVSEDLDPWLAANAEELAGLEFIEPARAVMAEFGRLTIPTYGKNGQLGQGFALSVNPLRSGGVTAESARFFTTDTGVYVFPFAAYEDGPSELVITRGGQVLWLHWAQEFYVADSTDQALITMIRGEGWRPLDDETVAALR